MSTNKKVVEMWALGRDSRTDHLKSTRGDDGETWLTSYAMPIAVRWHIGNGAVGEAYQYHRLHFYVNSTPSVTTKRHLNMARNAARDGLDIFVERLPKTREEALVMMDQHLEKKS